jgi:phage gp16-like protein
MAARAFKKQDGGHRKALLAKVHIAVSQLGIADEDYRDILQAMFRVRSSAQLSDRNLENLIRHFIDKGFKAHVPKGKSQTDALRIRAKGLLDKALAEGLVNSASGLVKKICGVDELNWCKDAGKLKRLLAVLDSIEHGAQSKAQGGTHAV